MTRRMLVTAVVVFGALLLIIIRLAQPLAQRGREGAKEGPGVSPPPRPYSQRQSAPTATPRDDSPPPESCEAPGSDRRYVPPGTVMGRVVLPNEFSAVDVRVSVQMMSQATQSQERLGCQSLVVDPLGHFRCDNLPPGRYFLSASHPRLAPHARVFEMLETHGVGPLTIVLRRGGALRVTVLDSAGLPATAMRISVLAGTRSVAMRMTDHEGLASFACLEPGVYTVEAELAPGKEAGCGNGPRQIVTVASGGTVALVFRASASVGGRILGPDGKPMSGVTLYLWPEQGSAVARHRRTQTFLYYEARTDTGGWFSLEAVESGTYDVQVQATLRGCEVVAPAGRLLVRPADSINNVLRIGTASVTGNVRGIDELGVRPLQQVTVYAKPVEVKEERVVRALGRAAQARPDRAGRFLLFGLTPGWYEVRVSPHDQAYRATRRLIDFTRGGHLDSVDFVLKRAIVGTLRLDVREPDGSPATGVSFSAVLKRSGQSLKTRTLEASLTDAGVFDLVLDAGAREIIVSRGGFCAPPVVVTIVEGKTSRKKVRLRRVSDR